MRLEVFFIGRLAAVLGSGLFVSCLSDTFPSLIASFTISIHCLFPHVGLWAPWPLIIYAHAIICVLRIWITSCSGVARVGVTAPVTRDVTPPTKNIQISNKNEKVRKRFTTFSFSFFFFRGPSGEVSSWQSRSKLAEQLTSRDIDAKGL